MRACAKMAKPSLTKVLHIEATFQDKYSKNNDNDNICNVIFVEFLDKILATKCDGNRNIFQLAVTMCQPTGGRNHAAESNNFESASKNSGLFSQIFKRTVVLNDKEFRL